MFRVTFIIHVYVFIMLYYKKMQFNYKKDAIQIFVLLYTGKILPRFIFALLALLPEGKFKTGLIELYLKDYMIKLYSGQIQDWANQFQISVGQK